MFKKLGLVLLVSLSFFFYYGCELKEKVKTATTIIKTDREIIEAYVLANYINWDWIKQTNIYFFESQDKFYIISKDVNGTKITVSNIIPVEDVVTNPEISFYTNSFSLYDDIVLIYNNKKTP